MASVVLNRSSLENNVKVVVSAVARTGGIFLLFFPTGRR